MKRVTASTERQFFYESVRLGLKPGSPVLSAPLYLLDPAPCCGTRDRPVNRQTRDDGTCYC
jgi:hypothetical protein